MADTLALTRPAPPVFARGDAVLTFDPMFPIAHVQIAGAEADAVLAGAMGCPVPAPGRWVAPEPDGDVACAWVAPGEWMLMGDAAAVAMLGDRIAVSEALTLVTDLTHARGAFVLTGAAARDLLSAHCPLDLADPVFPERAVARSLLGEAGVLIARRRQVDGNPSFRIVVDVTMVGYAARMLAGPASAR